LNPSLILPIRLCNNQIFTDLTISANNKSISAEFKIDTGCNTVLLNHRVLNRLGIDTSKETLEKLPIARASIADGTTENYRHIGNIALYTGNKHICDVPVICHTSKETRNLLGTTVLHLFNKYSFQVKENTVLELY